MYSLDVVTMVTMTTLLWEEYWINLDWSAESRRTNDKKETIHSGWQHYWSMFQANHLALHLQRQIDLLALPLCCFPPLHIIPFFHGRLYSCEKYEKILVDHLSNAKLRSSQPALGAIKRKWRFFGKEISQPGKNL